MTQHFKLAHPAVSSISVDGVEHCVNPDTGLLEVEIQTPGLARELFHRNAHAQVPQQTEAGGSTTLSEEDSAEREALFEELDKTTGRRVDRRRSLPQLREMKAQFDRDAAKESK